MSLVIAPAAPPPPAPSVSIFWKIGRVLVIDHSTLDEQGHVSPAAAAV